MKHIHSFLVFCTIVFLSGLAACSNPDISNYTSSSVLVSGPDNIIISQDATAGSFDIIANTEWSLSGIPSWLYLSEKSGNGNATVNYTVDMNPSCTESRSASMTLKADNLSIPITVSQAAASESMNVDSTALNFLSDGGQKTLQVTSNSSWTVEVTYSKVEGWLSLSSLEGNLDAALNVTAAANSEEEDRQATLVITSDGGIQRVVKVSQAYLYKPMPEEDDNEDPGL